MGLRGLLHILTLICACASTYGVRPQCDFKLVPLDLRPKGCGKMSDPWHNDGLDVASCISTCKEKHPNNKCIIVSFNNKTQTCQSWSCLYTGRKGKDPVDEFFFTRINPCTPPFQEYTYDNGKGTACINKKDKGAKTYYDCFYFCRDIGGQVYKNFPMKKSKVLDHIRNNKFWTNAGKFGKTYHNYRDNGVSVTVGGWKWGSGEPTGGSQNCITVNTWYKGTYRNEMDDDCTSKATCTCERFYY